MCCVQEDLALGIEAAYCPSCTLVIRVIYDKKKISNSKEEAVGEDKIAIQA